MSLHNAGCRIVELNDAGEAFPVLVFYPTESAQTFGRYIILAAPGAEPGVSSERVIHRVIPNAGHYAFLSPFPASMVSAEFAPSQDPPGFDRVAFHQELHRDVFEFLRKTMVC